ncbi:MAG: DNRLRE domain-containing protein [Myxococcota bacterium]
MSRLRSLVLGLLGATAALVAAPPVCADFVIVPVAADTAPYSFLPSLARGSSTTLYAFRTFDENSTPHDFETYLRFDVDRSDLPEGHVLAEATLVVTYAFDFTGFGDTSDLPGTLACREVLEPWSESTLTWSNRPDVDVPFDTITDITGFGALLCDATPVVLDWINGLTPNDGIALTSPTPRVMGLHSRESAASASSKPQLILRTELPEPGVVVALAVGTTVVAACGRRRRRSSGSDRAARPEQARARA